MLKKISLGIAVALVVLGGTAALYVTVSSRTPLPAHPPVARPTTIDLAAYRAGKLQVPGETWERVDPALLGWSAEGLESARQWAESLETGAVFVAHRGVAVADWGATSERFLAQSVRKSLLSGLLGRLVEDGRLDLDATLAELDIQDHPPLTPEERQATVRDLLLSRSGVYHSALYETAGWKRRKPKPGSHAPDEAWFYNNWGFNLLGTLFARAAGIGIGEAFESWIAKPIGMEDFRPADVTSLTRSHLTERIQDNESDYDAYMFHISSRDLARFGLLYLAKGRWDGKQVVSEDWVEQSTFGAARPTGWDDLRFGYLWWVRPPFGPFQEPMLFAQGGRGQKLFVIPELDLVVVHRVPTKGIGLASQLYRRFVWAPQVTDSAVDELLIRLAGAMPGPAGEVTTRSEPEPGEPDRRQE